VYNGAKDNDYYDVEIVDYVTDYNEDISEEIGETNIKEWD
jgi:hypothetical protein